MAKAKISVALSMFSNVLNCRNKKNVPSLMWRYVLFKYDMKIFNYEGYERL